MYTIMENRKTGAFHGAIICLILTVQQVNANPIPPSTCSEPSDLVTRYEALNTGLNITQFFLPPSQVDTQNQVPNDVVALEYESQHEYQGTTCPTELPRGDYSLKVRSMCPWYITINHDPMRYPTALPNAVKRCPKCVGGNGQQVCEYIYQKVKVLRRVECVQGLYRYVEATEEIRVGAVCAQRREVLSGVNVNRDVSSSDDPVVM